MVAVKDCKMFVVADGKRIAEIGQFGYGV
jgi:hypothetical protein